MFFKAFYCFTFGETTNMYVSAYLNSVTVHYVVANLQLNLILTSKLKQITLIEKQ